MKNGSYREQGKDQMWLWLPSWSAINRTWLGCCRKSSLGKHLTGPFLCLWSCHYAHFPQGPLATRQSTSQPDTPADSRHHEPVVGPQLRGTSQLCISNWPSAIPHTRSRGSSFSWSTIQQETVSKLSFGFFLWGVLGAGRQGTHLLQASQSGPGVQEHKRARESSVSPELFLVTPNNPQIRP